MMKLNILLYFKMDEKYKNDSPSLKRFVYKRKRVI